MQLMWKVLPEGYSFNTQEIDKERQKLVESELEMLYMDDKASKIEGGYLIPHKFATALNEESRDLLELPPLLPYRISIKNVSGNLGSNNFRYLVEFLKSDGTPIINPKRIGSYLKINNNLSFMLNSEQFNLVELASQCNDKIKALVGTNATNFNLVNLAKIKEIGKCVEAEFDHVLKNVNVVVPEKLSVTVERKEDGTIEISPVLLKKSADKLSFVDVGDEGFKSTFNSRNVQSSYLSRNGIKYVIPNELKEGLEQIKINHKLEGEKARRFLAQPKEILDTDAFEFQDEDISLLMNATFSQRVTGEVDYQKRNIPLLRPEAGGWLPEEGSVSSINVNYEKIKENPLEVKEAITKAQENKKTTITIDGDDIVITPYLISFVNDAINKNEGNKINVEPTETRDVVDVNEYRKKILGIIDNFDQIGYVAKTTKGISISDYYSGLKDDIKLYEHQKKGVEWVFSACNSGLKGVLVADDMGLGKTMQSLAFISAYKKAKGNKCNSVLIVAPIALLKNWEEEYYKFVKPDIFENVIPLHSGNIKQFKVNDEINLFNLAENKIVLTTYETLRDFQQSFAKVDWSVIIADEAQKIKNPTIMTTMAIKAMKYDFAICLTGTPVENSWIDLWSILDFAVPGKLSSLNCFMDKYQKKLVQAKNNQEIEELGKTLEQEIQSFYIRRLKKNELPGLPKKHVFKCPYNMPELQEKAYDNVLRSAKAAKTNMKKGYMLEMLAKLRDISLYSDLDVVNTLSLTKMDKEEIFNKSARLKKTFNLLEQIRDRKEKVLIFVVSRKMQVFLRSFIEKYFEIEVPVPINGQLEGEKRQAIIDKFNLNKGFGVLILSPEAGGVGFNITSANNVIHLSRCWNPAKEDQATDRVYRIGQKKDVNVYIPLAIHPLQGESGSFDCKLDRILDYKRSLSEKVLFPTADTEKDGLDIMISLTNLNVDGSTTTNYWEIDDLANVTGTAFEKVIGKVYEKMGYPVDITPPSNDFGADVIVWKDLKNKKGVLIQCKQTSTDENRNADGVEEVCSAIGYYGKKYVGFEFEAYVVTNAHGFTQNARERAEANKIRLITYNDLNEMLTKYPVEKMCY